MSISSPTMASTSKTLDEYWAENSSKQCRGELKERSGEVKADTKEQDGWKEIEEAITNLEEQYLGYIKKQDDKYKAELTRHKGEMIKLAENHEAENKLEEERHTGEIKVKEADVIKLVEQHKVEKEQQEERNTLEVLKLQLEMMAEKKKREKELYLSCIRTINQDMKDIKSLKERLNSFL